MPVQTVYGEHLQYLPGDQSMDSKTAVIGILVIAVGVLGYLYWDSQQTKVDIRVPGVSIQAK